MAKPKRLTAGELLDAGEEILFTVLDPIGAIGFVLLFQRGQGDYTRERRERLDRMTPEEQQAETLLKPPPLPPLRFPHLAVQYCGKPGLDTSDLTPMQLYRAGMEVLAAELGEDEAQRFVELLEFGEEAAAESEPQAKTAPTKRRASKPRASGKAEVAAA